MDQLISTLELAHAIDQSGEHSNLVILDATMHLPDAGRDARGEYLESHIPGALFLDLASFVDPDSSVPNAIPTADQFSQRMTELGISPRNRIVIYDDSKVKTSSRAWFIISRYSQQEVLVLDGGMGKWKAEDRALSNRPVEITPTEPPYAALSKPRLQVCDKQDMLTNIDSRAAQVVDVRDAARFEASHIPGSHNIPFPRFYNEDGTFKAKTELEAVFRHAGLDVHQPIITSCGSGVTACIALFALGLVGGTQGILYDGSWSDWGADEATPKETGPARSMAT